MLSETHTTFCSACCHLFLDSCTLYASVYYVKFAVTRVHVRNHVITHLPSTTLLLSAVNLHLISLRRRCSHFISSSCRLALHNVLQCGWFASATQTTPEVFYLSLYFTLRCFLFVALSAPCQPTSTRAPGV